MSSRGFSTTAPYSLDESTREMWLEGIESHTPLNPFKDLLYQLATYLEPEPDHYPQALDTENALGGLVKDNLRDFGSIPLAAWFAFTLGRKASPIARFVEQLNHLSREDYPAPVLRDRALLKKLDRFNPYVVAALTKGLGSDLATLFFEMRQILVPYSTINRDQGIEQNLAALRDLSDQFQDAQKVLQQQLNSEGFWEDHWEDGVQTPYEKFQSSFIQSARRCAARLQFGTLEAGEGCIYTAKQ
ncbi:MAG: hypothetical protein LQ339_008888 [Xanthoria mediterranea]|nr:MAG: hypothetical protein LQ339_008888 [Xanthoria mediterranea]